MVPTPACQLEVLFLEAVEPPGGAARLEEVCHWGQVFEGFTLLGSSLCSRLPSSP